MTNLPQITPPVSAAPAPASNRTGFRLGRLGRLGRLALGAVLVALLGSLAVLALVYGVTAAWRGAHVCSVSDYNKKHVICNHDDRAITDASSAMLVFSGGSKGFAADSVLIELYTVDQQGEQHRWGSTIRSGLRGYAQAADTVASIFEDANVVLLPGQTYRIRVGATDQFYTLTQQLGSAEFSYQ